MRYSRYEYVTEDELHYFEFRSIGRKGTIKKVVEYSEMSVKSYFNLAFGDYNDDRNEIDDEVITNNGDAQKVLATVVSTLYAFTSKYPDAKVFATAVQMHEHVYTEWVFLIIWKKSKAIFMYMV